MNQLCVYIHPLFCRFLEVPRALQQVLISYPFYTCCCCCCCVASVVSDSVRPHRRQPTRLPRPQDSPGTNTGVGCHFLLQCMKVKVKVKSFGCVRLLATPSTAALQAPPSMGFSRQEYWSGCHSSVYMSITISRFVPPPSSPALFIRLFSTSVSLFLLRK